MTKLKSLGIVDQSETGRRIDYLYRISLKALIRNEKGEILVVKEIGRDWWDLPGGGMDHGENIESALARELKEEVNLEGAFTYRIISFDEPAYLKEHDFWQVRIIFEVIPEHMEFSPGEDGDEITFIDPAKLEDSDSVLERRMYNYSIQ